MISRRRVWMIGLLLLVSSCTGTTNAYAGERGNFYGVLPVYCYDGDTCRFLIPWLPPPFTTIKVRLPSMNTPEIKGACPEEITVAVEAKRTLEDAVLGADRVDLIDVGPAGIYGRHLAEIVVWKNRQPTSMSGLLLGRGLAVRSKGKRVNVWCPASPTDPAREGAP